MALLALAVIGSSEIVVEGLRRVFNRSKFRIRHQSRSLDEFWEGSRGADESLSGIFLDTDRPLASSDLERIRRWSARVKIVLIASESRCQEIMPMAGDADGVILTSAAGPAMVKAMELIALGLRVYPSEIFQITLAVEPDNTDCRALAPAQNDGLDRGWATEIPAPPRNLSEREVQVVNLLCNGSPNKIIARELGISEATVKVHVKAILRKTKARNRTEAALMFSSAVRQRWMRPEESFLGG